MSAEPHPIDQQVGSNVRRERKAVGMSQDALARTIGVTFQQLQKYERGQNRISASKLWDIAEALNMPVAHLFPRGAAASGLPSPQALDVAVLIEQLPSEHVSVVQQVVAALRRQSPNG